MKKREQITAEERKELYRKNKKKEDGTKSKVMQDSIRAMLKRDNTIKNLSQDNFQKFIGLIDNMAGYHVPNIKKDDKGNYLLPRTSEGEYGAIRYEKTGNPVIYIERDIRTNTYNVERSRDTEARKLFEIAENIKEGKKIDKKGIIHESEEKLGIKKKKR